MAEIRGWRAVLCFPQVATKTQITAEQYLRMTFEHDAEFVHGETAERATPDYIHSRIQVSLSALFKSLRRTYGPLACAELRSKIAPDVYRAYTRLGLQNVSSFTLPDYPFQLRPSDLFNDL